MLFLVVFRSLGATYTVYTNLLLALYAIFFYQPLHRNRKISFYPFMDSSFIVLLLFCVSYVVVGVKDIRGVLTYVVTLPLLYVAGWVYVYSANNPTIEAKRLIFATMIGNGIHAILNTVVNIGNERGSSIDFFTRSIASETISGSINIIILSTIFCVFIEKNRLVRNISVLLILASLFYALQLATRSTFLIAAVVFVICFLLYLHEEHNKRRLSNFLILFIVSIVFVFTVYCLDLFSFRTALETSNMVNRMRNGIGSSDIIRFERFFSGINNLFLYPMGSSHVSLYYHNTWLDVARIGGIISFVFYFAYTVISLCRVFKLQRDKRIDSSTRFLFLCVYLGVYMNLFFEPGMEGFIELIYEFTMINGMIDCLYYSNKRYYIQNARVYHRVRLIRFKKSHFALYKISKGSKR